MSDKPKFLKNSSVYFPRLHSGYDPFSLRKHLYFTGAQTSNHIAPLFSFFILPPVVS